MTVDNKSNAMTRDSGNTAAKVWKKLASNLLIIIGVMR
jgi:hypothetical protein